MAARCIQHEPHIDAGLALTLFKCWHSSACQSLTLSLNAGCGRCGNREMLWRTRYSALCGPCSMVLPSSFVMFAQACGGTIRLPNLAKACCSGQQDVSGICAAVQ